MADRDHTAPHDLMRQHAWIRVFSGAIGHEDHVMAEGQVIGWQSRPTLYLRHADGSQSSWSVDLPRERIAPLAVDEVGG